MITTDNIFELHPPGTVIGLIHSPTRLTSRWVEEFTVGEDGLWRNEYGMIPAGQVTEDPEPPRHHCEGCRCGRSSTGPGRIPHGGGL